MEPIEKVVLTTTFRKLRESYVFRKLRESYAYESGYRKLGRKLGGIRAYGKETPINLLTILEFNGVPDVLWCIDHIPQIPWRVRNLIIADLAMAIVHFFEVKFPKDSRIRDYIQAKRSYALGEIGINEMRSAEYGARDAHADASNFSSMGETCLNASIASFSCLFDDAFSFAYGLLNSTLETREKQKEIILKYLKR